MESSFCIPFPVIMGPTASGKSELALCLAEMLHGEIISADSMQIYRGLNIGTAKPSAEDRLRIPHHLIDIMDITQKFDVYSFRTEAERLIREIRGRGHLPVVAGGTGLYLRALMYGLDDLPASPEIRKKLDAEYDNEEHFPELLALMKEKDPQDHAVFSGHRRKLIRAYEIFLLTGKPMISFRRAWEQEARQDARSFVLVWENTNLRERIALRCRKMLQQGWIEEAESFLKKGLLAAPTAWQVLGYKQIGQYLSGEIRREELEAKIICATWQYARRQNTWFRTQHPEAERLRLPDQDAAKKIAVFLQKTSAV